MEGSIRVSAKTVEDAILEASIQLGTSSDNIEYMIIERETRGFLGIGAKKAVIEAKKKKTDEDIINEVFGNKKEKTKEVKEFKKPEKEAVKPEKEFKAEKEFKKASAEGKEGRKPEKEQKKPEKEFKKEFKEAKKENKKEFKKEVKENKKPVKAAEPKPEQKPEIKSEIKAESKPEPEAKMETAEEAASVPRQPKQPVDPKEAESRAEEFLKNMFATMDMQVEIHAEFSDDTLNVDISGDDMGVLIGKRGQTLDSIQYLVSLVVNKGKSSYIRVKLDTENYRNRRKATLENLAKNIAFKVKKTRRPVYLEPMNPYERRIIHSALQNDPYVTTHSEGEEPCRKVVVTLKKRERNYYHNREQREQKEE